METRKATFRTWIDLGLFGLFVISSGAFLALWRDGGARAEGIDSYVDYVGPLTLVPYLYSFCLGFLSFVVYFTTGRETKRKVRRCFLPIAPLMLLALSSAIWASNSLEALKASVPLFLSLIFVSVAIGYYGAGRCLSVLFWTLSFLIFSSVFYVLFLPSYGVALGPHDGYWQGVFAHKNYLGGIVVLFLIVATVRVEKASFRYVVFFFFVSVFLSYFSGSTSAYLSVFLQIALLYFVRIAKKLAFLKKYKAVSLQLFWLFVAFNFVVVLISMLAPDLPVLGKDSSYSGRDKIWTFFVAFGSLSPLFGHGVGQFIGSDSPILDLLSYEVGFAVTHAHSGIIEAYASLGVLGVFFVLKYLHSVASSAQNYVSMRVFVLGVLPIYFLNFFEARLVSFNVYMIAIFIIGSAVSSLGSQRLNISA